MSEGKFAVTDTASAEWVLEKLTEAAAKRADIEAQYEKMVSRYKEWREKELEEVAASEAYFNSLLATYAREQLKDGKKKSLSLPSGKIGFRYAPPTFFIGSEKVDGKNAELVALAKTSLPEYVKAKTVESVDWAGLKKRLLVTDAGAVVTSDGQVVEGLTGVINAPTFYVKLEGGAQE